MTLQETTDCLSLYLVEPVQHAFQVDEMQSGARVEFDLMYLMDSQNETLPFGQLSGPEVCSHSGMKIKQGIAWSVTTCSISVNV